MPGNPSYLFEVRDLFGRHLPLTGLISGDLRRGYAKYTCGLRLCLVAGRQVLSPVPERFHSAAMYRVGNAAASREARRFSVTAKAAYCQDGKIGRMVTRIKLTHVKPLRLFFKEWRVFAGLTQEQVAEKLGITAATVSRIENGKRDFTGSYLSAFVYVCNCPNPGDPVNRPPDQISIDGMFNSVDAARQERMRRRAHDLVAVLFDDDPGNFARK